MRTLHIMNRKFDMSLIDQVLRNQLPGKYQIIIHTKVAEWVCKVKWNGIDWDDLYQPT